MENNVLGENWEYLDGKYYIVSNNNFEEKMKVKLLTNERSAEIAKKFNIKLKKNQRIYDSSANKKEFDNVAETNKMSVGIKNKYKQPIPTMGWKKFYKIIKRMFPTVEEKKETGTSHLNIIATDDEGNISRTTLTRHDGKDLGIGLMQRMLEDLLPKEESNTKRREKFLRAMYND